ncbi:hypothetical protein ACQPXS_27790 [Streptomyces sp. CA-142005]|uniref:hypothetical protein n=1 Tax=Streptomyces sp. CA-142005 TaxID=3240052 RepID=UPI003D8E8162
MTSRRETAARGSRLDGRGNSHEDLSSTVRRLAGPAPAAGLAVTAFTTPASAVAEAGSTVTRFV